MQHLNTIHTPDTEQKVMAILKLQIISLEIKKETKTNTLYKEWASDLGATKSCCDGKERIENTTSFYGDLLFKSIGK